MNCFIKTITNPGDTATDWHTSLSVALPVTIVSLSGFGTMPTKDGVHFFLELCRQFSIIKRGVIVCRNAPSERETLRSSLNDTFVTLPSAATPNTGHWWLDPDILFAPFTGLEAASSALQRHWKLPFGNWLLIDSPSNPSTAVDEIRAALARSRNISDLRALLLSARGFGACTFDNNMFDLLVRACDETTRDVLRRISVGRGISLSFEA